MGVLRKLFIIVLLLALSAVGATLLCNKLGIVDFNQYLERFEYSKIFIPNNYEEKQSSEKQIEDLNARISALEGYIVEKDSLLEMKDIEMGLLSSRNEALQAELDEYKSRKSRFKELADLYSGMKSKAAAEILAEMETTSIVKVFALMKEDLVSDILSEMTPQKAAEISNWYASDQLLFE